jgi:hypothetical protein
MRRRAAIAYGDSPKSISCIVWDLSGTGARISAPHINLLPNQFALLLQPNGEDRRVCQIVWRDARFVGVSFVSQKSAERINSSPAADDVGQYWLD